jgi:thiol:disulfide interchange protein DsbD
MTSRHCQRASTGLALVSVFALGWTGSPLLPTTEVAAQSVIRAPHVTVSLIPEYSTLGRGGKARLAVKFDVELGWHIYFAHPGQSGIGTRIRWMPSAGVTIDSLRWPVPERLETEGLVTHVYQGAVVLVTTIHRSATAGPASIAASVDWGACQTECLAGSAELRLSLADGTGQANPAWAGVASAISRLPGRIRGLTVSAVRRGSGLELVLTPMSALPLASGPLTFFPMDTTALDTCAVGTPRIANGAAVLPLNSATAGASRLRGILTGWRGPGLVVDVAIGK